MKKENEYESFQIANNKRNEQANKKNISDAKKLGTDILEATYFLSCCSECAKYRGRLFSISGKDKRFPKKPENYICTCSGLVYYPFIYNISKPIIYDYGIKMDILKFSNRPFVDDRTEQEKKDSDEWFLKQREKAQKDKDKVEYEKILNFLPDIAPKNFATYRRMKKLNTDAFKQLCQQAKRVKIQIKEYEN